MKVRKLRKRRQYEVRQRITKRNPFVRITDIPRKHYPFTREIGFIENTRFITSEPK